RELVAHPPGRARRPVPALGPVARARPSPAAPVRARGLRPAAPVEAVHAGRPPGTARAGNGRFERTRARAPDAGTRLRRRDLLPGRGADRGRGPGARGRAELLGPAGAVPAGAAG